MIDQLIAPFFPNERLQSYEVLGAGLINKTIKVHLAGRASPLLLQEINTRVFPDAIALMGNFVQLAAYLQQQPNYPLGILDPIRSTAGLPYFKDAQGAFWRILPFFEGTYAPEQLPTPEEALEAAWAYGTFLKGVAGFPLMKLHTSIPDFHHTVQRYKHFRSILHTDIAQRAASVTTEIAQIFEAEQYAIQVDQMLKNGQIPIRPVHNDTKAGNVLLYAATGKAAAVIDWDTVMPGSVLSDYGDMVRTFVSDRYEDATAEGLTIRKDVWNALDEGFLAATTGFLTKNEREHLHLGALWIISEQALRFLSDYLDGDRYYKTNYPEHNLVRARNQLALLAAVRCK
jgi:Phosphotransferase enzyme family